ncbi:hypothetical protein FRB98_001962 [Tulasnella sp. 332]|nr:hypothetical protein FRB98_001962 [Tulasnella sp. 332]
MDEDADCFVIPFDRGDSGKTGVDIPALKPALDITGGRELRFIAYRRIWDAVRQRSQDIVRRFHSSLTDDLNAFIHDEAEGGSEDEIDAGGLDVAGQELLPPMLKTAIVFGGSKTILANFENSSYKGAYTTLLLATDCSNLSSATRCLVSGFLGQVSEGDGNDDMPANRGKRSGVTYLAPNDMKLLEAWYIAVRGRHDKGLAPPKLVVSIPDVEAIDPTLLEDLFYICSLHARTLPFVFMLAVSTSIDYLQRTLSHSSMTFLDVTFFEAVGGEKLCAQIVDGLFFDPSFDSGIILAPDTLLLISDISESQLGSVDGLLSSLQLLLLNHCSKPLSVFLLEDSPEPSAISEPFRRQLLVTLTKDMDKYAEVSNVEETGAWASSLRDVASDDVGRLLKAVGEFRGLFFVHANQFRDAFGLMKLLHSGMESGRSPLSSTIDLFSKLQDVVELDKQIKHVVNKLRARSLSDLQTLLQDVQQLFEIRKENNTDPSEDSFVEEISAALAQLSDDVNEPDATKDLSPNKQSRVDLSTLDGVMAMAGSGPGKSGCAEKIGRVFEEYLTQRLVPFHLLPLHDVWCIPSQSAKHVTEVLNPSIYSSITSALARPHAYLQCTCCIDAHGSTDDASLVTLPDESIVFLRYLNSGKMVNVYDWFDTFAMGLGGEDTMQVSPRKQKNKSRRKEEKTEEEEEEWRQQLQARFLRCFHEFDLLGLLKQTGRKQDHVMRTVYEMED